MTRVALLLVAVLSSAACGESDDPPALPDAGFDAPVAPPPDAPPPAVVEVPCRSAIVALTVDVVEPMYAYEFFDAGGNRVTTAAIKANEIVKFSMVRNHRAESGTPGAPDGRFRLQNGEFCIRFPTAGTYPFYCQHQETATITVAAN